MGYVRYGFKIYVWRERWDWITELMKKTFEGNDSDKNQSLVFIQMFTYFDLCEGGGK